MYDEIAEFKKTVATLQRQNEDRARRIALHYEGIETLRNEMTRAHKKIDCYLEHINAVEEAEREEMKADYEKQTGHKFGESIYVRHLGRSIDIKS